MKIQPKKSSDQSKMQSVDQLLELDRKELTFTKPTLLTFQGRSFTVKHWTDVSKSVVEYLVQQDILKSHHAPVLASKKGEKCFLNNEPINPNPELKGDWFPVGDLFINLNLAPKRQLYGIKKTLETVGRTDIDILISIEKRSQQKSQKHKG